VTVKTNIPGATIEVLQSAIGGVSEEAYTNAKKLSGTGIVGTNDEINADTETFIGQVRWHKPLNPVINTASLTDSTDGAKTSYTSDFARYVKSVRTHGAEKVNMQKIVTGTDALAKIGRDFGETRMQDEHNAIFAVMKGVAVAEALNGAASGSGAAGLGGQNFDNDPTDKRYGMYVDLGANKSVVDATTTTQGAARAQGFLDAFGMAYKDYEPDYVYLVTSPQSMSSFRSANLVDQDRVVDGDIEFQTLFNGKFRLINTRAFQSMTSAQRTMINTGAGVDIVGTKTSFLVLPGAIAFKPLDVPESTEITRRGAAYQGGGVTDIWNRWGYVIHPQGYDWVGSEEVFADDASYQAVLEGSQQADGANVKALTAVGTIGNARGVWNRKTASALSLGILPVFHS
jgi:hypothetical protein